MVHWQLSTGETTFLQKEQECFREVHELTTGCPRTDDLVGVTPFLEHWSLLSNTEGMQPASFSSLVSACGSDMGALKLNSASPDLHGIYTGMCGDGEVRND